MNESELQRRLVKKNLSQENREVTPATVAPRRDARVK
jgi:hypothetical protein